MPDRPGHLLFIIGEESQNIHGMGGGAGSVGGPFLALSCSIKVILNYLLFCNRGTYLVRVVHDIT